MIGEWLNVDSDGNVSEEEDPGQDDGSPSATIGFHSRKAATDNFGARVAEPLPGWAIQAFVGALNSNF